jgi:hypothetical protein
LSGLNQSVCGNWEPTFKSLKVLDAENPTEMGKNDDGSAGGTTNSMEPLQKVQKATVKTQEATKYNYNHDRQYSNISDLRFD